MAKASCTAQPSTCGARVSASAATSSKLPSTGRPANTSSRVSRSASGVGSSEASAKLSTKASVPSPSKSWPAVASSPGTRKERKSACRSAERAQLRITLSRKNGSSEASARSSPMPSREKVRLAASKRSSLVSDAVPCARGSCSRRPSMSSTRRSRPLSSGVSS